MCKLHNPTIAIIDSGIGGISILKELIKKYNAGKYIYFSDNKYMPYGNKSKEFLLKRLNYIIAKLKQEYNADLIIVACNTASSVLKNNKDKSVITMKFLLNYTYLATNLTKKMLPNKQIIADKTLAKGIEQNTFNKSKIKRLVEQHIKKYTLSALKTLVLGCTHYELVADIFKELCPNTNILCNSECLINDLNFSTDEKLSIVALQSIQSKEYRDKIIKLIRS